MTYTWDRDLKQYCLCYVMNVFLPIANDNTVNKLMMIYFQRKIIHIIIYHSREQTREMYSILKQSLFSVFMLMNRTLKVWL
jgi:hypothetical protein